MAGRAGWGVHSGLVGGRATRAAPRGQPTPPLHPFPTLAHPCSAVIQREDDEGIVGVKIGKELMTVAGKALEANITRLGPLVLPMSEKLLFAANWVGRKASGREGKEGWGGVRARHPATTCRCALAHPPAPLTPKNPSSGLQVWS